MAFSTLENLGTWGHPSCGSAPHLIQSSHVVSGQPANGVIIRWSCAGEHGDGGLSPRQHKMTTMTTESWIVREFVINFINFGSIYLLSVNNLKGQCKFNIRRFRFFRVDGGGHPQALGLHIACCRLPRRHDGRLLPSLGLVRIPQKNSPLSDFPAPPLPTQKDSPVPPPLSLTPSPSLTPRGEINTSALPSLKSFGSLSALEWAHRVLCFTIGFTVNLSSWTTFHNHTGFVTIWAASTLYIWNKGCLFWETMHCNGAIIKKF